MQLTLALDLVQVLSVNLYAKLQMKIAEDPLRHSFSYLEEMKVIVNIEDNLTQKTLSEKLDKLYYQQLLDNADVNAKLRLTAVSVKHASDWIKALPNEERGLKLSNNEYSTLIKLWTGMPIVTSNFSCSATNCTKTADKYGYHALTCLVGGDRLFRHNLIRKWVYNLAKEAILNPDLEKGNLLPDHPNHRPADVYIPAYSLSKPAAIDITVTSPLQPTFQQRADTALNKLQAAKLSELAKHTKYDDLLKPLGITFIPFAVEVFGGVGNEGSVMLKDMFRFVATHQNGILGDIVRYHMELLSVSLQRCNARSILSRLTC